MQWKESGTLRVSSASNAEVNWRTKRPALKEKDTFTAETIISSKFKYFSEFTKELKKGLGSVSITPAEPRCETGSVS